MSTKNHYRSLYSALKGWYCRPLDEYPEDLRSWIEHGLGLGMKPERMQTWWAKKSPASRLEYAKRWDYGHDPATRAEREEAESFPDAYRRLEQEIDEWEHVATPTALDLTIRKNTLAALRPRFDAMTQKYHQLLGVTLEKECIQLEYRASTAQRQKAKAGRPKTIEKKAHVLRQVIEAMTKGANVDPADLPGSIADLFDACQRIEKSKLGKCHVFRGSLETFRSWLKASGYGFQGGRPPKEERRYWTERFLKTTPLIEAGIFTEVFDTGSQ